MSAQLQIDEVFNSLEIKKTDQEKIDELKERYDEDHIDVFLEKLESMSIIDVYIDNEKHNDNSNQFIDFISELILKK